MFSVTSYEMDDVISRWTTNPTSDAHSFLSQGPSTTNDSLADRRPGPLDIPPHSYVLQVDTETYPLSPLMPATHIHDVDEGARTLHLENDIADVRDLSSSVAHSLDTMFRAGLSSIDQTPTNSNKVFEFPLVISNDHLTCIDHGDHQPEEGRLMNVSSVQGHRYTQSDTTSTSSNSEPSIPSGIFCAPAIMQYQEQRASRGLPKQLQEQGKGKGPIVLSSQSSRRPAGARGLGARNGPYLCDVCGKAYTQRQGVARHRREIHDARLCSYCGIFKWGRRYVYKKHLQTKHSDEATGSGRM